MAWQGLAWLSWPFSGPGWQIARARGRYRWPGLLAAAAAAAVAACSEPKTSSAGAGADADGGFDLAATDLSATADQAQSQDAGALADSAKDTALPDGAADAGAASDSTDTSDAKDGTGTADAGDAAAVADAAVGDAADSSDIGDTNLDITLLDSSASDTPAAADGSFGDLLDPPDGPPDTAGDATAEVSQISFAGCADGTREAFLDQKKFPTAAACGGAWDIAGIHAGVPACGRKAGNDGSNAAGKGCTVEDLCAEGWHVCFGAADLKARNPLGCGGIMDGGAKSPAFFLARSSSTGAFNCSQDSTKFGGPGTSNDLFGCGNLGCGIALSQYPTCDPLDKASHDLCKGLRNDKGCGDWCSHLGKFPGEKNNWDCGNDSVNEANKVLKTDPASQGGVLCCADAAAWP